MNIVIINSSDTFEYRVKLIYEILKEKGHRITVVTSDYMHVEKKYRHISNPDFQCIHTVPYKKNISCERLFSHYKFSRDAYNKIKEMDIDLLYIVVPPNSQASIARRYKRVKKNCKVVMDVIDLWPESLPTNATKYFPFTIWAGIRNQNLKYADHVITECNMYQERLEKYLDKNGTDTLFWSHKENDVERKPCPENTCLNLCYLGSVNNIIDIPEIGRIIKELAAKQAVTLKIAGDGERRAELIETAAMAGAKVIFYGKVYDPQEKQDIFDSCHFGMNIMKKQVCVGLSMKSIDYFEAGLPVLNNLPGDTEKLIREESAGINAGELGMVTDSLVRLSEKMRPCARGVYEKYFSYRIFRKNFQEIMNHVLRQEIGC